MRCCQRSPTRADLDSCGRTATLLPRVRCHRGSVTRGNESVADQCTATVSGHDLVWLEGTAGQTETARPGSQIVTLVVERTSPAVRVGGAVTSDHDRGGSGVRDDTVSGSHFDRTEIDVR